MKKKYMIIIGITIVLLIIIGFSYLLLVKKEEKPVTIKHQEAEKVYNAIDVDNNCTAMPQIGSEQKVETMNEEILMYLIFNQMKKDDLLKEDISKSDYEKSAKKILSDKYIPKIIKNYEFDGYRYTMTNDKITRKEGSCGNRKYVSKLYGYSTRDNTLELDVVAGYIENHMVYDLDGKELGAYKKDTLNSLLDQGTMQVYTYEKERTQYKLLSIHQK